MSANDAYSEHLSDDNGSDHEDGSQQGSEAAVKTKQQQTIPTTTTISNIKLPILKKEDYDT